MTPERGIAVAAFAIGLAVVVLALFGWGEEEAAQVETCDRSHSAMPIAAAHLDPDGRTLRIAYAGAEPCHFAVELYRGRLYVELRTNGDDEVDRYRPVPSGCAVGELERRVPADTPVEPFSGLGRRLVTEREAQRLINREPDCLPIEQGQASFIIN